MTAHEPTPTVEHTDAVARVVAGLLDDFDTVMNVRAESREVARRLLTSTDPAVHLALVDALVRAGVIAEETYVDWCDHEDRDPWEPGQWIKCGQPADHRGEHKDGCSGHRWPRRPDIDPSDKPEPRMRRYATEWSSDAVCGRGLHFGRSPRAAHVYYSGDGPPRFLACEIDLSESVPLDDKIKARSCRVLHEVDLDGNEVAP